MRSLVPTNAPLRRLLRHCLTSPEDSVSIRTTDPRNPSASAPAGHLAYDMAAEVSSFDDNPDVVYPYPTPSDMIPRNICLVDS